MKVGILVAMSNELALLLNVLQARQDVKQRGFTFITGTISDVDVVVMQCGIGKVNAAIGTTLMMQLFEPDAVINTGVAGAGDSKVAVGDVVVSDRVAYHDVYCGSEIDLGDVQGLPHYFKADDRLLGCVPQSPDTHVGLICSGDWFVDTLDKALAIKQQYPEALAVDMESGAIAQVCHVMGVPFMSVRIISDSPLASKDNSLDYNDFWVQAPQHTFEIVRRLLASLPGSGIGG